MVIKYLSNKRGDYKSKKIEKFRQNGDAKIPTKIEPAKCATIAGEVEQMMIQSTTSSSKITKNRIKIIGCEAIRKPKGSENDRN